MIRTPIAGERCVGGGDARGVRKIVRANEVTGRETEVRAVQRLASKTWACMMGMHCAPGENS